MKIRFWFGLPLLFFIPVLSLRAQPDMDRRIDSLVAVTRSADDSASAKAYNSLANIYSSIDLQQALAYNRKALELAQKSQAKSLLANIYNSAGVLYSEQGKTAEGFFFFNAAIDAAEKAGSPGDMAKGYLNVASTHFSLGAYDKALEMNLRSLALFEQVDDAQGILDTYVNIANIYAVKKDYTMAKLYYGKARNGYKKRKDKVGEAAVLANLAGIYKTLAVPDTAQMYFEAVVEICENENMPYYLAVAWEGLGAIYGQKGEYDKAHQYLN